MRTREPLGNRKYWPLYEVAEAHGLPLAIHVGGHGGNTITGAGWPSFYFEDHAGYPQAFQAQVLSLVVEGVFERFPGLKVVLQEGGFAWLPLADVARSTWPFELLRDEVAHLERKPSETIREHFWFTTQPIEEPERPEWLPAAPRRSSPCPTARCSRPTTRTGTSTRPTRRCPRRLAMSCVSAIFAGNASALYPSSAA